MVGGSLNTGSLFGNLVALFVPINFAFLILLIRKYSKLDLVPALFYGGVIIMFFSFLIISNSEFICLSIDKGLLFD